MCCVVIRSEEHGSMKIESNRIIQYICFQQIQSSSNNNNSDLIEFRDEKKRLQRVLNIILYIHLRFFLFLKQILLLFFLSSKYILSNLREGIKWRREQYTKKNTHTTDLKYTVIFF